MPIWLSAVKSTHHFLTEEDINFYLPLVKEHYIPSLEVWVAENSTQHILGFMGLADNKVEMLFIDAQSQGQGVGKQLLAHARALKGHLLVDVNEQNPDAHQFYLKQGFTQIGRSELDGSGQPFPLLHLAQ